jgi:NADH:ubiquinone oxidoreductase subunit K
VTPVTHFAYVAAALLCLGVLGLVGRRSPARTLAGLQAAAFGAVLVLVAWARWWGTPDGHVVAVIVLLGLLPACVVGRVVLDPSDPGPAGPTP